MVPKTYFENAPQTPGVYLFKNRFGKILYVGKAKRLKDRLSYYFQDNLIFGKTRLLMNAADSLDFIQTVSEIDALILEADFIKKFRPQYNEALKDGKSYAYIRIGKKGVDIMDQFPTVSLVRAIPRDGTGYFGPYPTGSSIRSVLKLLRRLFGFRDCSPTKYKRFLKLKHGCLFFDLGLCPAPCITDVSLNEYNKNIKGLKKFLTIGSNKIESDLTGQMSEYSKTLNYEKALQIKNKLELLSRLRQLKFSPFQYSQNPNLSGEQRNLELNSLIGFINKFIPGTQLTNKGGFRIEAYDISNTSGQNSTASMVVFVDGAESTKDYRKFKIRGSDGPNDYQMIAQVISRRFSHAEWTAPDLLLIDGGLGQVNATFKSLPHGTNIPIIGLAKRLERPAISGKYRTLPKDNPAINLLKRIRDEAHRFAKSYHKLLRSKYAFSS